MENKKKKGKFADWKLSDWCIYAGFVLLCFALLYGAWNFIRAGGYLYGFLLGICFVPLAFICLIPIFSKPIPKEEDENSKVMRISLPKTSEGFIELTESIGLNDKSILAEVRECLAEPEIFLEKIEKQAKKHGSEEAKDLFEDLSAEYGEYKEYARDAREPSLQGALILLNYRKILAIFDWKADRETFTYRINNLITNDENRPLIEEATLPEWESVEKFCRLTDKLWEGYHTVLIDNDSDSSIVGIRKNKA